MKKIGLRIRNGSEANILRFQNMPKESRMALAFNAHAAVRGKKQSVEHRLKIAATRAVNPSNVSKYEIAVADWLKVRGIETIPQMNLGIYNIDLAIAESRIAVEVFGGNWHFTGKHAAIYSKRVKYITSQGWSVVVIWAVKVWKTMRFDERCADYIAGLHNVRRFEKPGIGQEHVIWGNGQIRSIVKRKCYNVASVDAANSRLDAATCN
jgi:very-short-patch-repair endonuclease